MLCFRGSADCCVSPPPATAISRRPAMSLSSTPNAPSQPHTPRASSQPVRLAFIGGGNMASAIVGGLLSQGWPTSHIEVVEPWAEQRERLAGTYGLSPLAEAGQALADCELVVWAVKPQSLREAATACRPWTRDALHLSVAAGIRSDSLAEWLDSPRIVRAMPNTPALVGQGMTGLCARPGVTSAERQLVEAVLTPTGQLLWLAHESQLDAVTALSGSGPAYVFYFIEAMVQAGTDLGLPPDAARQLALGTFVGASALARASDQPPDVLRQQVTSKGGTTHAAISHLEQTQVKRHFVQAMHAAAARAKELGDEFGR